MLRFIPPLLAVVACAAVVYGALHHEAGALILALFLVVGAVGSHFAPWKPFR